MGLSEVGLGEDFICLLVIGIGWGLPIICGPPAGKTTSPKVPWAEENCDDQVWLVAKWSVIAVMMVLTLYGEGIVDASLCVEPYAPMAPFVLDDAQKDKWPRAPSP